MLEEEHVYSDAGNSGATLNRPGQGELHDAAAMAEFDVVLITAPDRLARSTSTSSCSLKSSKVVAVG